MNGISLLCDAAGSDMLNTLYSPPEPPKQPAPPKRKLSLSDASPSATHVCHICKRVYERADHLTRHLRSHENARPYQCSRCPKRFNRADLLTRHETTHDRDSTGKGRTFIRRSDRAAEACLNCAASKSKCEVRCHLCFMSSRCLPPSTGSDLHRSRPARHLSRRPLYPVSIVYRESCAAAGVSRPSYLSSELPFSNSVIVRSCGTPISYQGKNTDMTTRIGRKTMLTLSLQKPALRSAIKAHPSPPDIY